MAMDGSRKWRKERWVELSVETKEVKLVYEVKQEVYSKDEAY